VDLAGERLSFRGDLVVEVVQTTFRLRLDFLLRHDQAAVLSGAVLAPGHPRSDLRDGGENPVTAMIQA
jgi:hypothetical protein